MYALKKYQGKDSRKDCPNCHRKRCFSLYVNEEGKALAPMVGRCDHESKCGYHYKPKDFFREHPGLEIPDSWKTPMEEAERRLCLIEESEVRRFRSDWSTLLIHLRDKFPPAAVEKAAAMYQLGALIDGSTIYWQIDKEGRVRTGKVMAYGTDGHRIKNPENDRITWMHSLLKIDGLLPADWELTQCLFGEHLLNLYPDMPVGLVESEKTAVIMSMHYPDLLWLSCGGKNNLKGDLLAPLYGRKVYLYPDADAMASWSEKAGEMGTLFDIRVCDPHYTEDDIQNKRDIADLVINQF